MLPKLTLIFTLVSTITAHRTYVCDDGKCTKESTDSLSSSISLQECKLTCLKFGGIWPAPTGSTQLSNELVTVNTEDVNFVSPGNLPEETAKVVESAKQVFLSRVKKGAESTDETHSLTVKLSIDNPNVTYYTYDVDEKYFLKISTNTAGEEKKVTAEITAPTFLGARHGLETLAQLIVWDDLHERSRIPNSGQLEDQPKYKHRGLNIDTARSYMPISTLKEIIDSMAQNKLNSFHWHITDTHSFPYVSNAYPIMSDEGAYSKSRVYTQDDIKDIVEYARVRGVRVTPELDAPAHVGEGWAALDPDLITCFRWEPWGTYCVEPPCGQFNPIRDRLYDILHTIYQEWASLFHSDLFHMGGDEVNLNCWNSTASITKWMADNNINNDHDGLLELWNMYQKKSREQLKNANPNASPILWTSTLTEEGRASLYLDPKDYIIQIWTKKDDRSIANLIGGNYKVIFTNYDELYLDCGGGPWIGGVGQNWCSPYIGWQTVYNHDPVDIIQRLNVNVTEAVRQQLLGSMATLWTEQVDDQGVGVRLWPRAAALAERLWTSPSTGWEDAQYRMNNHRDRMVRNGASAELLQPEWCLQNDGHCGTG